MQKGKGAYTWYRASANHHRRRRSAQVWHVFSRDFTVLPAHPQVHPQSEWAIYLPLPSQPQLVLIYRPRRDGRLSIVISYIRLLIPWCEVAQAEIRTRNLPIANPALYHTATSAKDDHVHITPVERTIQYSVMAELSNFAHTLCDFLHNVYSDYDAVISFFSSRNALFNRRSKTDIPVCR